jgi:hypothetical protein
MWRAIATLAFQVLLASAFPIADSPTLSILMFVDHPPVTSGVTSFLFHTFTLSHFHTLSEPFF